MPAISMVWNFRIAQITKQLLFATEEERNCTIVALLFDQTRKKRTTAIHQNYAGGLGSYMFDFESYYFRADFAVSHIQETCNHQPTFSDTETDDILLTIGRNWVLDDHADITLSGLFGIPTHKVLRLQHADFGYGQIGAGIQLDGIYAFNDVSSFIYGTRYIRFFSRNACDNLGEKFLVTIGNVVDILVADKNNWGNHGIEFGYTARFRCGAYVFPEIINFDERTNYMRSNFYGVYKYKFLIGDVLNRVLFNISYGVDHKFKPFGNKYILTFWTSWNITF